MRYSFVDVETTGLDPNESAIIELAIVTTDAAGIPLDRFETILNPLRQMKATKIHGIRAADITAAPTFPLVAAEVADRLDGTVLVAYNASFDRQFVSHAMKAAGGSLDAAWICALDHARGRRPDLDRHRLVDVAAALGCDPEGSLHSALIDAELCASIFFALGACDQPARPATARSRTTHRVPSMTRDVADDHGTSRRPVAKVRDLRRSTSDITPIVSGLCEAFDDGKVTLAEVKDLGASLEASAMTAGDLLAAFNGFLDVELARILTDGVVDGEERDRLRIISHHLGYPAPYIEGRLEGQGPIPLGGELQPGLAVVFTNVEDDFEWELAAACSERGICPRFGVSTTTDLVVFDGSPTTGKARKAQELGVPLMPLDDFCDALGVPSSASTHGIDAPPPAYRYSGSELTSSAPAGVVVPSPPHGETSARTSLGDRLRRFVRGTKTS